MSRCKKRGEPDCSSLYYCASKGENATSDGRPMQEYCYYCLSTPRAKKIAHACMWTGLTPKWCPDGRTEEGRQSWQ